MKKITSELQHKKMTETPITSLLVSLSLPSVANMLLSSVYNMADTYFVTSLGESAIGGVGIVFSIQSIIQSVGFGVSMGGAAVSFRVNSAKRITPLQINTLQAQLLWGLL